MRPIYTLLLFFLLSNTLVAQVTLEEEALEQNVVLHQKAKQQAMDNTAKLTRLFGAAIEQSRSSNGDCEQEGELDNGQTAYVISGETFQICLDTTGFVTFDNLSVDGNAGTISIDSTCVIYVSNSGLELGLGDTIRIENCLPDNGACTIKEYPLVVIREGQTFIEPATVVNTEEDAILCVLPGNFDLPEGIASSSVLDCHDPLLASISNGNSQDSCVLLTAKRLAGLDTVCLELSNDFCISDTFKFPFRVNGDTLDLPFVDEFSYDGPFPNTLWVDKRAYVNKHWGYQPPSVGFATMDGLDETGTPYGGGYGRSDFLTSNYLDLGGFTAGSNVYLTCYVQRKGYGLPPNEGDSLVLEFKNNLGDWELVQSFQGFSGAVDVDSLPPFEYFSRHINNSDYLYKGFQFRFVNYASRSGIRDVWHIDYVRLASNEIPDGSFEDIAFTNTPNDILSRYSSMPWVHFDNGELIDEIDIELFSQFDVTETADPSSLTITELVTGTNVVNSPVLLLTDAIAPENQRNVPPQTHKFHTNPLDGFSLPGFSEEKLIFETKYSFEVNAENPGLFPQVEENNVVTTNTVFDNYFAYDDGSAETSMRLGDQQGEAVAVSFTATVPDTLRAVQIHFPHYSAQDIARFNLKIHVGELGNSPVYEKFAVKPFFADEAFDTLQGYTTYQLIDDLGNLTPVELPVGDFHIELEQGSNSQLTRIGLDKNTPEAKDYQSFKLFGQWVGLANNGAMMVRPVVGSETPGNTPVEEVNQGLPVRIYPNPTNGLLYLEGFESTPEEYDVTVYNALGQVLLSKVYDGNPIDLSSFASGYYYVKVLDKTRNQIKTQQLVLQTNRN